MQRKLQKLPQILQKLEKILQKNSQKLVQKAQQPRVAMTTQMLRPTLQRQFLKAMWSSLQKRSQVDQPEVEIKRLRSLVSKKWLYPKLLSTHHHRALFHFKGGTHSISLFH